VGHPIKPNELKKYWFKELDIIQSIIKRMAKNSFQIKGWTITLVVGSMVLSTNPLHRKFSFIPCCVFWYLDAYFLQIERQYRKLWEWVILNRSKSDENLFDLKARDRFSKDVDNIFEIMLSKTLLPFYGITLLIIIILNCDLI